MGGGRGAGRGRGSPLHAPPQYAYTHRGECSTSSCSHVFIVGWGMLRLGWVYGSRRNGEPSVKAANAQGLKKGRNLNKNNLGRYKCLEGSGESTESRLLVLAGSVSFRGDCILAPR